MSSEDAARVFFPKHFTLVFSEVATDMINNAMIKINVVYLGSPMLICFLWNSVITVLELTLSEYGPIGGNVF